MAFVVIVVAGVGVGVAVVMVVVVVLVAVVVMPMAVPRAMVMVTILVMFLNHEISAILDILVYRKDPESLIAQTEGNTRPARKNMFVKTNT